VGALLENDSSINRLDLELASELVMTGPTNFKSWLEGEDVFGLVSPHLREHLLFRKNDVAFWVSLQDDYLAGEKLEGNSLAFNELSEMLFDSLKSGINFTLTRWGDGEGMALPVLMSDLIGWVVPNDYAQPESSGYQDPLRRACDWAWREIWFGKNFLEESRENRILLGSSIMKSVRNSSILAYYRPEPFKSLSRFSPFRRSLGAAMLKPVLESIRPVMQEPLSPRLHIRLYRDGVLSKLLAECRSVLVVTSKADAAKHISETCGAAVDLMLIPSEQGRQLRVKGTGALKSDVSFLSSWFEIIHTIKHSGKTWDLILVGGGLVGKAIVGELSTVPSVVLDVGSIMDNLAGFKTRSWMKPTIQ